MKINGIITAVLAMLTAASVAGAEGAKADRYAGTGAAQAADITADLAAKNNAGGTEAIKSLLAESGAADADTGGKVKAAAAPVPAPQIISAVPTRKFVMEEMSETETQLFLQRIGRGKRAAGSRMAAEHCWHTTPSTVNGQTCWQVCCEYPTSENDSSETCYDDCSDATPADQDNDSKSFRKKAGGLK